MPMELQSQRPVAVWQCGCKSHHRASGVAEQKTRRKCVSSPPCRRGPEITLSRRMPAELQRCYRPGCGFESRRGRHTPFTGRVFPPVGSVPQRGLWPRSSTEEQVMFRHPFVAGTNCQGLAQFGRVPHPDCGSRRFESFIPDHFIREECLRGYLSFTHATPRNSLSSRPNSKGNPRRMPKELHASNQTGSPGGSIPPLAIAQTANARHARGGSRTCFFTLVAGGYFRRCFHDDVG